MKKFVYINKMQCGEVSCKLISSFEEAQELVNDYIDMLNEEVMMDEQTDEVRFEKIKLENYFSTNSNYNVVTLDDGSIIEVIEIER